MSRHTSYRGVTIDMDTMRRENEKAVALGNMSVNARGDKLGKGGTIIKTADQIARENHKTQAAIINTGLKGPVPASPALAEQKKSASALSDNKKKEPPLQPAVTKKIEKELPNGDIIVEDNDAT